MKARAPTPLFEQALIATPSKALTPTPLPEGEGRTERRRAPLLPRGEGGREAAG